MPEPVVSSAVMRCVLIGILAIGLAGCAPNDIARSSCESILLSTAAAWSCTVKGELVGRPSSIEFSTESRNQVASVLIALQITKGRLRVRYHDLSGEQRVLVTPAEPANFSMQTRMHRDRRSFTLVFEPVDGAVEGLAGTVRYSTP